MTIESLEKWLIKRLAAEIGIEPRMIEADAQLYNYLMNGFQSFGVVADLEQLLGRKLSPSILYEQPTISALAKYLAENGAGIKTARQNRKAVVHLFV